MTSTPQPHLEADLLARMKAYADPAHSAQEKAYHKSPWEHWGVAAPKMDLAIRETLGTAEPAELLRIARDLWSSPVWDHKMVAARILTRKSVLADATLWKFVTSRMRDLDAWAIADNLSTVGSRCLLADESRLDVAESWVASPHLWTRRASLVFTLPWTKGDRDPERMLGWAGRLSADPEWFIQKAIGWWLRELSKRDPARVRRFLDQYGGAMKSFARREAGKYLDAPVRHKRVKS